VHDGTEKGGGKKRGAGVVNAGLMKSGRNRRLCDQSKRVWEGFGRRKGRAECAEHDGNKSGTLVIARGGRIKRKRRENARDASELE